ncbi:hypothetical protein CPB84DRAFT_1781501 [Gymnopilus junonius]|uniref:Uncharacterized protein n=1 Tax=Gymnopilus junonius TaxID=109634 RepID=A0A9P5NL42_GYMJU|nr:hypothetical protein CPB84DRAFT_1781501 [Gymnopilus junonius]
MSTAILLPELPPYESAATPPNCATTSTTISSPPGYSVQPREDEEVVAFTPRLNSGGAPSGAFTRYWQQATLILKDQEEGTRLPTYGRNGRIIGELGLKNTDKIIQVTVKLHGQMSLSVADSGSISTTLISETQDLWKQCPAPNPQEQRMEPKCPSILPIYIQFPAAYEAEGKYWRLPPSFEATFLGIPALFVRCTFSLSITITRTRSYHLASWTTSKTYITLVNFRPRTRPSRPIVLIDTVFASLKPVPEEWLQVVANMKVRPKSDMKPIECHLFIPSVQTYALTDVIPFHLQLSSSLQSLRELLPPSSEHLQVPGSGSGDNKAKVQGDLRIGPFRSYAIRMSIARQVVVEVHGLKRFRTFTVGVGKIWSVPPALYSHSEHSIRNGKEKAGKHNGVPEDGDVYLDWQGEVKCWGEVSTGGFSASNLIVKDFLVLSLTPPNPRSSFLMPMQLSHPIDL